MEDNFNNMDEQNFYQESVEKRVDTVEEKKTTNSNLGYKVLSGTLAVLLVASIGFTSGVVFERNKDTLKTQSGGGGLSTISSTSTANYASAITMPDKSTLTIPEIVNLTTNSVVEIATETVVRGSFIRNYVAEGAGSGVIISEDGYIVTNNHVIDDANKIMVKLKNGESYEAKLIGKDADTDIAVLKIDAKGLKAAVLGDSDKLVVGEFALAIGNPLGELGGTVTDGIISALDREIELEDTVMNLLQTNAAINPGNSGGGLFNGAGELIGITVAKSAGNSVEGLGFAIPINDVKKCIDDIKTYGYVKGKVQMGVNLIDISDVYTAMMYRVNSTGVYIQSVTDGSSADKAGLKTGDKIVEFNGVEIDSYSKLKKAMSKCEVGQTVDIVVIRDGRERTFKIYLTEANG
ncbi:MAG: trypsin-like peptidase domain-containing protein [Clostridia bacterium]|nr:trypsin-like peptidase domain-containing protein [Clostridia bacterium]